MDQSKNFKRKSYKLPWELVSWCMKCKMGETTMAQKAHSIRESLRTTIPASVVRQLKIKEGDTLDWEFAFENNEMYVKLKKVKVTKK